MQWVPPLSPRRCAVSGGGGEEEVQFSSFEELASALAGLSGDPLEEFGGRVVHYRGNPGAKVVVVGEAPGATEDELGVPYVGRAGKLLDQILTAAGFDVEEDVYFTNVVKRRPPENRDPTAAELRYYSPLLLEELRLVDPWIVVCTGRFSMRTLLDVKQGITKVRGQWFPLPGLPEIHGMPMFHPSYLLRNPSRKAGSPKSLTWVDAQEIRRKFQECEAAHQVRAQHPQAAVELSQGVGPTENEAGAAPDHDEWMELDCPCSDIGGEPTSAASPPITPALATEQPGLDEQTASLDGDGEYPNSS
uniref:Type-4 uracil-DNA glycosylase n=1 Tax=Rhizochromulina marina TaxID=1034831 RepID=A0A7S2S1J0_9STRA